MRRSLAVPACLAYRAHFRNAPQGARICSIGCRFGLPFRPTPFTDVQATIENRPSNTVPIDARGATFSWENAEIHVVPAFAWRRRRRCRGVNRHISNKM